MTKLTGGGLHSRVVVRPGINTGSGAKGINPGYIQQIGTMQGDHATSTGDKRLHPIEPKFVNAPAGGSQRLGNEVALNSKSAPGQGRTIYDRGSQGQHGAPVRGNPPPAGELFPGFPRRRP
jgi:hypothetical protein